MRVPFTGGDRRELLRLPMKAGGKALPEKAALRDWGRTPKCKVPQCAHSAFSSPIPRWC